MASTGTSRPGDQDTCSHTTRADGVCTACGHCMHEVVLNGACYFCGATELDGVALSPRPADTIIPVARLHQKKPASKKE